MKCRRCLYESEHLFYVYTDELNIMVCVPCADEARRLGLPVRAVSGEELAARVMEQPPEVIEKIKPLFMQ